MDKGQNFQQARDLKSGGPQTLTLSDGEYKIDQLQMAKETKNKTF